MIYFLLTYGILGVVISTAVCEFGEDKMALHGKLARAIIRAFIAVTWPVWLGCMVGAWF